MTDTKPRDAFDVAADVGRVRAPDRNGHAVSVLTAWRREIVDEIADWVRDSADERLGEFIRDRFGGGTTDAKKPDQP